jgi:hypothetical protein
MRILWRLRDRDVGSLVISPGPVGTESGSGPCAGGIHGTNLAIGTTSALVVSNVDAYFGLSPDRTMLAYTLNRGTSADGLYVMTLPTTP